MEETLEYRLGVQVNALQREMYDLTKDDLSKENLKITDGLAKAIENINSQYKTNFETELGRIMTYFKTPIEMRRDGIIGGIICSY